MAQDQDTNGFEALGRVDNRLRRDGQPYTEEDRAALMAELGDLRMRLGWADGTVASWEELGRMIGVSGSILGAIRRGTYEGDTQKHLARIDEFLGDERLRAGRADERGFVAIGLAEKVFAVLQFAIREGSMALVVGQPGSGKSMIARAFVSDRENAYLVTVDTCHTDRRGVVSLVYKALGLKGHRTTRRRFEAIQAYFRRVRSAVLVIDECQRLRGDALECLRDFHDGSDPSGQRNTPIILFGDHSFYKLLMKARSGQASPIAPQLSRRIYPIFDLDRDGADGGEGGRVYSADDLARVLRNRRLRLVTDAGIEWLCRLANLDGWGRIGLAVVVARTALQLSRERPIGVAELRLGLRMVVGPQELEVDASSGGVVAGGECMIGDSNGNGTMILATRPVAGAVRRVGGVSFLAPPTGVPDLGRARRQLAGVPVRRRERAIFRVVCLRRLEKAERAANYRGRNAVIGRVAAKLRAKYPGTPVSRNSLYRWSARFERQGIMGLVERRGGRWRSARLVDEPAAMALPDLLDQTARLLGAVAQRLRAAGRDRA